MAREREREVVTLHVRVSGTVQGYALRGLSGRQRFVVVGSQQPLSRAELGLAIERAVHEGRGVVIEVTPP